jgi:hypothetical protein
LSDLLDCFIDWDSDGADADTDFIGAKEWGNHHPFRPHPAGGFAFFVEPRLNLAFSEGFFWFLFHLEKVRLCDIL